MRFEAEAIALEASQKRDADISNASTLSDELLALSETVQTTIQDLSAKRDVRHFLHLADPSMYKRRQDGERV